MSTVLFVPETWGEGETRRMLAVAGACARDLTVAFADHGGPWSHLLDGTGAPRFHLAPEVTPGDLERLAGVDQRRRRGALWPVDVVTARVRSETALLASLRPVAVVTGFCLSLAISARIARVPLVAVRPVTGTRHYYRAGLGRWTDARDHPLTRVVPPAWLDRLRNAHALRQTLFTPAFNAVARHHGLPRFRTTWDLFEGDATLLADVPDGAAVGRLPPGVVFVGPIDGVEAAARRAAPSGAPHARRRVVVRLAGIEVDALAGFDVAPVAACATGLADALARADVLLADGDGKVLLAACRAGVPVVGIGANPEHEANLDCLERVGAALRLRRRRADRTAVRRALERVTGDPRHAAAARRYRDVLAAWDGPGNAAREIRDRFGNGGATR